MNDAALIATAMVLCIGGLVFVRILSAGREMIMRENENRRVHTQAQAAMQSPLIEDPPVV